MKILVTGGCGFIDGDCERCNLELVKSVCEILDGNYQLERLGNPAMTDPS